MRRELNLSYIQIFCIFRENRLHSMGTMGTHSKQTLQYDGETPEGGGGAVPGHGAAWRSRGNLPDLQTRRSSILDTRVEICYS